MFIPTREAILDMSPTEFERYSLSILGQQISHITGSKIIHNRIVEVDDGNYQIDGYIEFSLMGVNYKTIIECKHYQTSITREKVQVLYDKVRACGANKGVLVSSSSFQSGAIDYASKHGIALIQLTEDGEQYHMRSLFTPAHPLENPLANHSYIGIMQRTSDNGILCSYLSSENMALKEYLEQFT